MRSHAARVLVLTVPFLGVVHAQELDGNPVVNGHRKLSPARRRHNGGVGFD